MLLEETSLLTGLVLFVYAIFIPELVVPSFFFLCLPIILTLWPRRRTSLEYQQNPRYLSMNNKHDAGNKGVHDIYISSNNHLPLIIAQNLSDLSKSSIFSFFTRRSSEESDFRSGLRWMNLTGSRTSPNDSSRYYFRVFFKSTPETPQHPFANVSHFSAKDAPKAINLKNAAISSGDVVQLINSSTNHALFAREDLSCVFAAPPSILPINTLFEVKLVDESNNNNSENSSKLLVGKRFRLKAVNSNLELGIVLADDETSLEKQLVMFESNGKSVFKTKEGQQGASLSLAFMRGSHRGLEDVYSPGGLCSMITGCRRRSMENNFQASVVSALACTNRFKGTRDIVYLIQCRNGSDTWTCIRKDTEWRAMVHACEINCKHLADTTILTDDIYKVIFRKHEGDIENQIRFMNKSVDAIIDYESVATKDRSFQRRNAIKNGWIPVKQILWNHLSLPWTYDTWLLSQADDLLHRLGSSLEVIPVTDRVYHCVAVRAVRETLWSEEVFVITRTDVRAFSIESRAQRVWSIDLRDVIACSSVSCSHQPLHASLALLRLETVGIVTYLGFASHSNRDKFQNAFHEQWSLLHVPVTDDKKKSQPPQQQQQRILDDLIPIPKNFFTVSERWEPDTRRILNARRVSFDSEPSWMMDPYKYHRSKSLMIGVKRGEVTLDGYYLWEISVMLLKSAHSLSKIGKSDIRNNNNNNNNGKHSDNRDNTEHKREKLITFLDDICVLKRVSLNDMDLRDPSSLCFFVNIYHTLLLHARLILGHPDKKEWDAFFSDACYEIGDEVFSLQELHQCVIRGKLVRPLQTSSSYKLPAEGDFHWKYALQDVDHRINFVINQGFVSNLDHLYVLRPDRLSETLAIATSKYLSKNISVDIAKKTVTLPKLCEVYEFDFGSDIREQIRTYQSFLIGLELAANLETLLSDKETPTVKVLRDSHDSHIYLKLIDSN